MLKSFLATVNNVNKKHQCACYKKNLKMLKYYLGNYASPCGDESFLTCVLQSVCVTTGSVRMVWQVVADVCVIKAGKELPAL